MFKKKLLTMCEYISYVKKVFDCKLSTLLYRNIDLPWGHIRAVSRDWLVNTVF